MRSAILYKRITLFMISDKKICGQDSVTLRNSSPAPTTRRYDIPAQL